jgi:hypothetical protein
MPIVKYSGEGLISTPALHVAGVRRVNVGEMTTLLVLNPHLQTSMSI